MAALTGSFSPITALYLLLLLLYLLGDMPGTYLVHVLKSQKLSEFSEHRHRHRHDASLSSVTGRSAEILYTCETVVHGFSTYLTGFKASALADLPGVLVVLPEVRYKLHTARTLEFLGLDQNEGLVPSAGSNAGLSDVVVGMLDTNIWPERKSFGDTGLGPDECKAGKNFNSAKACNKKLIGARHTKASMGLINESRPSRNNDEHGIHTSTTAGGTFVPDASLLGYVPGTASGMVTLSRWESSDYFRDSVAIGVFAAMESGILISRSSGNGGSGAPPLSNVAPWITTDVARTKPGGHRVGGEHPCGLDGHGWPTELAVDTHWVKYNIISGTSTSCPHVSGLAALLKGVHLGWSPAAARPAPMTSATRPGQAHRRHDG
ncbi:Subtilisin-like protease [Acorus calamus]|uniref:Subtilisin-like protease n=1 Tax=Acorus calamus TaxID=4465 RepID=A0AAV9FCX6_ACOCL|nr:Subtilisin-like protease [Acorus calamus]